MNRDGLESELFVCRVNRCESFRTAVGLLIRRTSRSHGHRPGVDPEGAKEWRQ